MKRNKKNEMLDNEKISNNGIEVEHLLDLIKEYRECKEEMTDIVEVLKEGIVGLTVGDVIDMVTDDVLEEKYNENIMSLIYRLREIKSKYDNVTSEFEKIGLSWLLD